MKNIKLVASDLDGTFLKDDRTISPKSLSSLHALGEKNVIRVAATGRNLHKVKQVLNEHVPFDFVVFSSGAGVYNWKEEIHLGHQNISSAASNKLLNYLIEKKMNFNAFYPAPENHKHWFFRGEQRCEEFERYFNFNRAFSREMEQTSIPDSELCQFLIIIPENTSHFQALKKEIESISNEIRVIRASSPITKGFIWIEIFHKSVSKGNGVKQICDLKGIAYKDTMGIGNDFNDFDLLHFTNYSFLTENAPKEIKGKYAQIPSNENEGFSFAVKPILE